MPARVAFPPRELRFPAWILGLLVLPVAGAVADDRPIDYLRDIKPVLKARCFACHGALQQRSGLRVDTAQSLRRGGESGPAFIPGDADGSELLRRVASADRAERMPPEGEPLTQTQQRALRLWIEQGAAAPELEASEPDPTEHWAFQPPVRGPLPGQSSGVADGNPIDTFIVARLDSAGLSPGPAANRAALLRRATLDLTGVPPTREELLAFLADEAPDAYERALDRLLASPRYGERWGRHWMDVWRYSDWFGRRNVPDVWNSAPQIWRWRDWIVQSLNVDAGYDTMVADMLAADERQPGDTQSGVATGYLIRNWYALNPNDWMRNTVEHVGKAFLGLTFNCAHCHDHKYDPISQEDYFRLRAIFEPIGIRQDRLPGEPDPGPFQEYNYSTLRKIQRLGTVRIYDRSPQALTWLYTGGDERNKVQERGPISPGVPVFLSRTNPFHIQPVELPPRGFYPGLDPAICETMLADVRREVDLARQRLSMAQQTDPAVPPGAREALARAEQALKEARGVADRPGTTGALVGDQSLLFDATSGRRILQNRLTGLKELHERFTIEFQVRLLTAGHFNFQLARDLEQGLTAAYVGFDQGRIISYRPGSYTEFEVGRFELTGGQDRLLVRLELQPASDQILLSVISLADGQPLFDPVPVALNGWNPVGRTNQGLSFDARTGSLAAVDELLLRQVLNARGEALNDCESIVARFDFEPPAYPAGRDVVGLGGWEASTFGQAPATSLLTGRITAPAVREAELKVAEAQRIVQGPLLRIKASQLQVAAANSALEALQARIAADRARFGETPEEEAPRFAAEAARCEREAAVLAARAAFGEQESLLATAEAKPAAEATRTSEIAAATMRLVAARKALEQAELAATAPTVTEYSPLTAMYPRNSTGRRNALASWIASRGNPLTARVAVNHIWLRHFHQPLVASVFDFGRNGTRPTHPELLDWLAVEFMDSGWSQKHLHRLLMTSAAYRRSSSVQGNSAARHDPENRLLWRMNVGRMEAEVVRDSLLHVAGRLDWTLGGQELENSQSLTTFRRSLYYSCQPEDDGKSPLGALFDGPEPADCYRRTRTIIPQQALALANSDLAHELSGRLAEQLWSDLSRERPAEIATFIVAAFQQILSRGPTPGEREACEAFLAPASPPTAEPAETRAALVRVLLNHNDFIAIR